MKHRLNHALTVAAFLAVLSIGLYAAQDPAGAAVGPSESAELQKALRGTSQRVRTFEALGQCFAERGQVQVAMTILQRALGEPGAGDDQLVGVLYLLGNGAEDLGRPAEAISYYQRVFAVDITFRDVADRMQRLEQAS